jgi:hypothetical protein
MRLLAVTVVLLACMGTVYADLQNVQVGGIIEMRGRYIHNSFNSGQTGPGPTLEIRGPASWFPKRPIGNALGVAGLLDWDDNGNDWAFYESAISFNASADFTDNVSAFIEFYSFYVWGQNFRSDYVTGVDRAASTTNDVSVLQSYIEIKNLCDQPLSLRIGRQQLKFGKNFLVADKTTPTQRLAFDAIRLTYNPVKELTIDAWASKLVETSPMEADGDVDFYGIYGTYAMSDAINASLYYMLIRDARSRTDTNLSWLGEQLEDALDLDDYDVTNLNTVGARFFGKYEGFDYNLDGAYQFGNNSANGVNYKKANIFGTYGDDSAEWGHWGVDGELGYTFDCKWKPRLFVGGVHFGGDDNRDVSFLDWLNPFDKPRASTSFNRLFSDLNYAPALEDNGEMSNFDQVRVGFNINPTEKLSVMVRGQKLWAASTFAWPVHWRFGRYIFPIAPAFSFWDEESSNDLGYHIDTIVKYAFSANLTIFGYYGHLFAGDGVLDGNYTLGFGNQYIGGTAKEDADYMFWWVIMKF